MIALLICWNGYLTFQLNKLNPANLEKTTIINNMVNGFTTDFTEVVRDAEPKVVGIVTVNGTKINSVGSGFVYSSTDAEAIIVTNAHVVDTAISPVYIFFNNGQYLPATLLGSDKTTDVAVLSVIVDFKAPAFTLTDSTLCKKGEYVIAIGNPYSTELRGTVTGGMISGLDRMIAIDTNDDGIADWESLFIQTDVAINQGNSGGPLINMAGELVGITTLKKIGDDSTGIGLVVPSNELKSIVEQLLVNSTVTRISLGINAVDVSALTAYQRSFYSINLDQLEGIYIKEVAGGSLSEEAGLLIGDIITAVNISRVHSMNDYRKVLYNLDVGEEIEIILLRDGKELKVTMLIHD